MLTVGSLCTGYGGLELGLARLTDVRLLWVADNDPAAAKVLAHHYPHVVNLGDLCAVDWTQVLRVDAITAGWPCQPWSLAGKRKGAKDGRAIWPAVADAVRSVRPRLVFLENVPAVAAAGELARACGDLASAGYLGAWDSLRASDVGAPHRRERLFIVAARADPDGEASPVGDRPERDDPPRGQEPRGDRPRLGDVSASDPGRSGPQGIVGAQRPDPGGRVDGPADRDAAAERGRSAADTAGVGRRARRPEPTGVVRGSDAALGRDDAACEHCAHPDWHHDADGFCVDCPDGCYDGRPEVAADADGVQVGAQPFPFAGGRGATVADEDGQAAPDADRDGREGVPAGDRPAGPLDLEAGDDVDGRGGAVDWAGYGPAIERWERELGRPAPVPTVLGRRGGPQLNPRFVEFLMGLPAGHVTDVPGLSRNQQLKLLGNGVLPQQAAYAFGSILALLESGVAA